MNGIVVMSLRKCCCSRRSRTCKYVVCQIQPIVFYHFLNSEERVEKATNCFKCYYDQKIVLFSPLDFKTMLTKNSLTQVLSSDFKKAPVYFNWYFLTYWSVVTSFKILRELGRGENGIKTR